MLRSGFAVAVSFGEPAQDVVRLGVVPILPEERVCLLFDGDPDAWAVAFICCEQIPRPVCVELVFGRRRVESHRALEIAERSAVEVLPEETLSALEGLLRL